MEIERQLPKDPQLRQHITGQFEKHNKEVEQGIANNRGKLTDHTKQKNVTKKAQETTGSSINERTIN